MNKYEAIFILDPRKIDDEGRALVAELTTLVETAGGSVTKSDIMGRKPFARSIKKRKAGNYVNINFSMPSTKVIEIRNRYRLDERVLRMLIIIDECPANYEPKTIVL